MMPTSIFWMSALRYHSPQMLHPKVRRRRCSDASQFPTFLFATPRLASSVGRSRAMIRPDLTRPVGLRRQEARGRRTARRIDSGRSSR